MKNLKIAIQHLQKDPVLAKIISRHGVLRYQPATNRFASLVSSIIGQQLSGKAADTIYGRFEKLLSNPITPQKILSTSDLGLRSAGMSWAKVRSLKDLSQKMISGSLQLNNLDVMTDEEVIIHLTQVKGIGHWTAEMKLMFTLHRPDVFPLDDRGIQNAMIKLYKLKDDKKLMTSMLKTSDSWRPFRTLACWYLWKSLDND